MKDASLIPTSVREAAMRLREVSAMAPEGLDQLEFTKAWFAVSYVYPGFHPDDCVSPANVLPDQLVPLAAEAWRRAEAGEIPDAIFYPADAQWASLCDRLKSPTEEEANRRREITRRYPIPG